VLSAADELKRAASETDRARERVLDLMVAAAH
jgi:hypothetical protein